MDLVSGALITFLLSLEFWPYAHFEFKNRTFCQTQPILSQSRDSFILDLLSSNEQMKYRLHPNSAELSPTGDRRKRSRSFTWFKMEFVMQAVRSEGT